MGPPSVAAYLLEAEDRRGAAVEQAVDRARPIERQMDVAAEGFRSGEEFATVAHAARNTNVPFLVLKHQVLEEGRSLADAIHQVKPDVDAKAEAARAQAAAKSDIAAVVG